MGTLGLALFVAASVASVEVTVREGIYQRDPPIPDALVVIETTKGRELARGRTNDDGVFVAEDLDADPKLMISVRASKGGFNGTGIVTPAREKISISLSASAFYWRQPPCDDGFYYANAPCWCPPVCCLPAPCGPSIVAIRRDGHEDDECRIDPFGFIARPDPKFQKSYELVKRSTSIRVPVEVRRSWTGDSSEDRALVRSSFASDRH